MSDDRRLADDIDAEIADHLERRVRELRGSGMTDAAARAQAAREFGDVAAARREMLKIDARMQRRGSRLWSGLAWDLRTTVRRMVSQPMTTAFIVLTLAFAIGIAAAVFSAVDQLILRQPPFPHADRLVDVWHRNRANEDGGRPLRAEEIAAWQTQPAIFERIETSAVVPFDLTETERPERVSAFVVSLGLFDMLGMQPLIGRQFATGDGAPGSERVALLSYNFWRARYQGSPSVLGSRISLNDELYTVVGVMPRHARLRFDRVSLWLPLDLHAWGDRAPRYGFRGIGRLAPGLDPSLAQAAADALAGELAGTAPLPRSWYLGLYPLRVAEVSDETNQLFFLMLGAVVLFLLLACVNVTSLKLGESMRRRREIELRAAIGAGRWRLMREVIVETVTVAVVAGIASIAVAYLALDVLLAFTPERTVQTSTRPVEIDVRILAVMAVATLGTGLLTGLTPALRSSRVDLARSLRGVSRGSAEGTSFGSAAGTLVIVQVALAMTLLVGTALMSRTLMSYNAIDPGFDVEKLTVVPLDLPVHRYPTEEARRAFFRDLDVRLRAHPGIEGSAYGWSIPPSVGYGIAAPYTDDGRVLGDVQYWGNAVSPDYFDVTGTRILAGRGFVPSDRHDAVVLSDAYARMLWPDTSAVGRRFRESEADDAWLTVVGVAGQVEARVDDARTPLQMYSPLVSFPANTPVSPNAVQLPRPYVRQELIVRAARPAAVEGIVREEIHAIDPIQPVGDFTLGTEWYAEPLARQRFLMTVGGTLAAMALLLAATGIFGLLSQAVTQRRREIGIRVALGASSRRIVRMLSGRGLLLALVGTLLGTIVSLAGVRTLESLLFGVSPVDPVSFVSVVTLVLLAALVACWWPTRRALAIEPAEVLRSE